MSDELRECPFCGERPRLSLDTSSGRDEWYIWCNCGMVTHFFYSDTAAVCAWNARTHNAHATYAGKAEPLICLDDLPLLDSVTEDWDCPP